MWKEDYKGLITAPGHQHNASMFLISPIRTLSGGFGYVEMFLQLPESALRFE